MVAYGSKYAENPVEDLEIGASVTQSCHLSYHNSPSHIGTERFTMLGGVGPGSPNYYILRPEVVESYFYLWRLTKVNKKDFLKKKMKMLFCFRILSHF